MYTLNLNYLETVTVKPIWWHYLCITVPDNVTRQDTGFLLIDGGSNGDS
jgi:PhoPQ-activated pathogenicity-related protein